MVFVFDEGQAGNCGLECQGFLNGDCMIPDEIIEVCIDTCREELLVHKYGELRLAVARIQTTVRFVEEEKLTEMILDGTARQYFGYS